MRRLPSAPILMLLLVLLLLVPACALSQSRSAPSRVVAATSPRMSDASSQFKSAQPTPKNGDVDQAKKDKDSNGCHVYEVTSIPGSLEFASHFMETMVSDPKDPNVIWGLTADLSHTVPGPNRALYISKSTNGGKTWNQMARLDSRYFDADIAEGLRNGLAVSPGGTDFVITTQEGAFQVFPQSGTSAAVVKSIAGPRVPHPLPELSIPKEEGDPVRAGVVEMTADGKHMVVAYGYFDGNPQLFSYRRDEHGSWINGWNARPSSNRPGYLLHAI